MEVDAQFQMKMVRICLVVEDRRYIVIGNARTLSLDMEASLATLRERMRPDSEQIKNLVLPKKELANSGKTQFGLRGQVLNSLEWIGGVWHS